MLKVSSMAESIGMLTTPSVPATDAAPAQVESPGTSQTVVVDLQQIRPALAEGVTLLGEAQGSGFANRMWLVQIDGRFIQLTELLYRVIEFSDGSRSLDEIATAVGEVSEWQMNADDVLYLTANKLAPLGLVHLVAVSESEREQRRKDAPSLLQLGLRRRMISAETIEPIARALQVLFNPVLLVPLLAIGIAAHSWLYFDRGVGGLLSNALYTPGLLLLVFIMTTLPGFWHEFGHASALRYGGGRARGIGVGIYIMDPAFYTDVTDSYRLGRWGRVRTGLGGIYFDMILSTLLIVAYGVTGKDALLLLVVLSNLNTIYQFFPLVRLDGYWVLADLTGIPDFYSLMGSYIRGILPFKRWKGSRLPDLKPWVRAFFGLYTLIAIPGLVFFFIVLMRRIPDIVTTAWDALQMNARDMPEA
jgi:putative peptide zinc metalloprotease protein